MIVENRKIEKYCSFYVSDFHLEMILLPYINKKIENNENIKIVTERDLKQTVEVLISKMNLKKENKEKILNLDWNSNNIEEMKENSNIIIIGKEEYIEEKNERIKNLDLNNITVTDCYNFEEVKERINIITEKYKNNLNTLGLNNF